MQPRLRAQGVWLRDCCSRRKCLGALKKRVEVDEAKPDSRELLSRTAMLQGGSPEQGQPIDRQDDMQRCVAAAGSGASSQDP